MKILRRLIHWTGRLLLGAVLLLLSLWTLGALFYDAHWLWALAGLAAMVAVLLRLRPRWKKIAGLLAIFAAVLAWWFTLTPRNDRDWRPEVAQTASAAFKGDTITLHNVRHFDYRTEEDFTPRWETRTVQLSRLTGVDMFLTYWGSPHIAHPIASFQFADAPAVCFSIETRKEKSEGYSTVRGLYRQFELIYIMADERDVIRLRTNYRTGEDTYLYRVKAAPETVRDLFLSYLERVNALHEKPQWYHALTDNCTTGVRLHIQALGKGSPWDWRLLLNGHVDERAYDLGAFDTSLPFAEFKARSFINERARAADQAPDFSTRIRAGLPGFSPAGLR